MNPEHIVLRKVSAAKFCQWTKYNYAGSQRTTLHRPSHPGHTPVKECRGSVVHQPGTSSMLSLCNSTDMPWHLLATKTMPGTLAERQQDWQRGVVPLTCWSKETWSGPFNHPTKCSSELLLWNQYDEKLCIIHLILCCYTTEKTKKPKPVREVERHTWEIMYVSGSSNFATHYKLKQCNYGKTGQTHTFIRINHYLAVISTG